MHHEIKLGYGDTISIHAPSRPLTRLEVAKKQVKQEQLEKYPIFKRVCDAFDISIDDILGRSRKSGLVMARFIIAYDLCINYGLQVTAVSRLLCRDHTSIMYYLRMFKDLSKNKDEKFSNAKKQLEYYEKN